MSEFSLKDINLKLGIKTCVFFKVILLIIIQNKLR